MIIPDWNKVKKQEKTIKIHYPEFYEYLMSNYPHDLPFIEKIYWYINLINEHPVCAVCGNRVTFKDSKHGYHRVCSLVCRNADPETKLKKQNTSINKYGSIENANKAKSEKIKHTLIDKYGSIENAYAERQEKVKQTNLERYGVEYALSMDNIKQKTKQTLIDKYGSIENAYAERLEKIKQTNLERYGVEHYMSTADFKEKSKNTCLERYGVEDGTITEEAKEKKKQTNLERYGVECSFQSDEVREKIKVTMLERYGVEYAQQNNDILKKSLETKKKWIIDKYPEILDVKYLNGEFHYVIQCAHPECNKCEQKNFLISSTHYWVRKNKTELCTHLLPIQQNRSTNTSIEIFIHSILDKYNVSYETNIRKIISPYELDIYIPSKKIAIECNGVRWHSTESNKSKDYHYNKYKKCLDEGIQLITFWEDQIIYKPDIIESMICSKLGIITNKIYARNCTIKEIDPDICSDFLERNHIQGKTSSKIKLGLYFNNELVSVMTFSNGNKCSGSKIKSESEWELNRFCSKQNNIVIGAASKLLKYFIKTYNPAKIISFACLDISNGDLYKQLGFEESNYSPGYWYVDSKTNKRYHRSTFTKARLVKDGYDPNMSESEIMAMRKFYKIYDCGRKKYVLELKKTYN